MRCLYASTQFIKMQFAISCDKQMASFQLPPLAHGHMEVCTVYFDYFQARDHPLATSLAACVAAKTSRPFGWEGRLAIE